MKPAQSAEWLVLLHQLPSKPPYFRVKVWRRLQAIGAVPLKNAAHVLPRSESGERAFRDLITEIAGNGGEAILLDAHLLEGQSDADLTALFNTARDADYDDVATAARRLLETGPATDSEVARLHKKLAEVAALDFFGSLRRKHAEAALIELDSKRHQHPDVGRVAGAQAEPLELRGRIWVTRRGVHVDRIACAWLVRGFIDPEATFKFVDARSHTPASTELRFDMTDGEFTHEGERCSFETLLWRAGLAGDAGLLAIGEMIHDLDIGDNKFGRPETPGLGAMLTGVCASTDDDMRRIEIASAVLNQFHAFFTKQTS
jgi:hypothetical protein